MKDKGKSSFSESRSGKIKICFKIFVFLTIGIFIFQTVQCILVPKWFVYTKYRDAGKLSGYYEEEKDSIDVIICGSSHAGKAIFPMEMYEKYGIKSYNLSTSSQTVEVAYYMLSEALKTQTPKVFVYDVSSLFKNSVAKNNWLYALDDMHLGKNKIAFAREYQSSAGDANESLKELLVPLLRYHTRWKELDREDFTALFSDKHYFGKGAQMNSITVDSEISVEQMNLIEDLLLQDTQKSEYVYDDGAVYENKEEDIIYSIDIPEKNIVWLEKIKTLCEENGIHFLAVKVPTMDLPQSYELAWTNKKYHAVQSLCDGYGITYYDLYYDTDINIDWSSDTLDKGRHFNLLGAQKVSDDLGNYLMKQYELPNEHNEQWDRDLLSYQKVRTVAQLQLERDFTAYINMLAKECQDKVILISAAGDMTEVLKDDISELKGLGLQANFLDAFQKSYLAVIENGEIRYEALSNRQLRYRGEVHSKPDVAYELYSSGWRTNPKASIIFSGTEWASNETEGLNIVVYDDDRDLVIDNVCFVSNTENGYTALRNNAKMNTLEIAFEKYVIEEEN